jgi:SAM-dependent methyltransferase
MADADWFQDPRFWSIARDSMFTDSSFSAAPSEVRALLELCGLKGKLDVLDLPCGPGRHSLAFARGGHRVVGVDLTEAYVEEARARFSEEPRLSAELLVGDMRTWCREGAFDLVANLYTSFGFFTDQDEDRACLQNFRRNLKEGGVLFMDVMSKEILARDFRPRDWHPMADGTRLFLERKVTEDWSWCEVTWSYLRDGDLQSVDFGHRLYAASELRRELADAGFGSCRIYGGFDGRPYDHQAQRLVVVAQA